VHLDQRRHLAGVTEVVVVASLGHRRRRRRLDRDHPVLTLAAQLPPDEREGQAGEVGATASAADDHVGLLAGHLKLQDGLLADDRLVEQDEIEDRAE